MAVIRVRRPTISNLPVGRPVSREHMVGCAEIVSEAVTPFLRKLAEWRLRSLARANHRTF